MIGTKTRTGNKKRHSRRELPQRQCALTKTRQPIDQLMRFVLSPDHVVTPDLRCKLPGRGLWLSADRTTIEQALKKNLFERGFRKKIVVNDDLADNICELARMDALASLSLANKAGRVITGFEKIKRALVKGEVKWLLHAMEAAQNGAGKLDRACVPAPMQDKKSLVQTEKQQGTKAAPVVLESFFTSEQLSLALGRTNVIHIGLKPGELARRFAFAVRKTAAFAPEKGGSLP